MANGDDEPADRDDGRVLAPDELDISDDEHVAEIEEGRYVVSPNDPIDSAKAPSKPSTPEQTKPDRPEPEPEPEPEPQPQPQEIDRSQVHEWLADELDGSNSRYGFDVTAKFDGPVEQRQMMSNDVVTIFESLILWYAQHIDTNTPVEEVLGILLMESNVPIRYPPESLQRVVRSAGLHPDDSIADLIEAIDDDGLKF